MLEPYATSRNSIQNASRMGFPSCTLRGGRSAWRGKGHIKMAPKQTYNLSHYHWPKYVMAVLDDDMANVYRKWSIESESPAKGDFV